ncbi:MAG: hypothetical protein CL887_07195 [Dehalococcoidia bacterium]|nr:hypothetical protein [Dehalococcoidia bacterium]|tara:strand:- start:1360 stop:1911 length:552 start_codon:yes stop_codon:yes gene_type:complete
MSEQQIYLKHVTRSDVKRVREWLTDDKVVESWFGRYSYGDPAHLGYHPEEIQDISEEEWNKIFENPEHVIFSVYNQADSHIGEIHIAIEESLGDGQLSILIGDTESWHKGFGTATLEETIKLAFDTFGLYRIWADIPNYNEAALALFSRIGFTHEGTLRQSRPHQGSRYDSVIMGMLRHEYEQ